MNDGCLTSTHFIHNLVRYRLRSRLPLLSHNGLELAERDKLFHLLKYLLVLAVSNEHAIAPLGPDIWLPQTVEVRTVGFSSSSVSTMASISLCEGAGVLGTLPSASARAFASSNSKRVGCPLRPITSFPRSAPSAIWKKHTA